MLGDRARTFQQECVRLSYVANVVTITCVQRPIVPYMLPHASLNS